MRTVGLTFKSKYCVASSLRFRLQFSAPIGASRTSRESILEKGLRERLAREGENYSAKHECNWCCKRSGHLSSYPVPAIPTKQLSYQLS